MGISYRVTAAKGKPDCVRFTLGFGFLVDVKYQSPVGRIEMRADYVVNLVDEGRIRR